MTLYRMINAAIYEDGTVTSTFEVNAPSPEIGDLLIRKHISKLFRNFPSGTLIQSEIAGQVFAGNTTIGATGAYGVTYTYGPNGMSGALLPGYTTYNTIIGATGATIWDGYATTSVTNFTNSPIPLSTINTMMGNDQSTNSNS